MIGQLAAVDGAASLVAHVARDAMQVPVRQLVTGDVGQDALDLLPGLFDGGAFVTGSVAMRAVSVLNVEKEARHRDPGEVTVRILHQAAKGCNRFGSKRRISALFGSYLSKVNAGRVRPNVSHVPLVSENRYMDEMVRVVQVDSSQIRGARAMLGWSMVDLARAARVSVSAVKRVEDGGRDSSRSQLGATLEAAGILFLPDDGGGPGMRLRVG